jgi:imidazolonepropionase-like amidohydrolase
MLIENTSQLLTLSGGPQRGRELGRLEIIPNGAALVRSGLIEVLGDSDDLRRAYPDEPRYDAQGCAVLPGFVDPHTHLVWAGDRAAELVPVLRDRRVHAGQVARPAGRIAVGPFGQVPAVVRAAPAAVGRSRPVDLATV